MGDDVTAFWFLSDRQQAVSTGSSMRADQQREHGTSATARRNKPPAGTPNPTDEKESRNEPKHETKHFRFWRARMASFLKQTCENVDWIIFFTKTDKNVGSTLGLSGGFRSSSNENYDF